jgi:hypothetical protein
VPFSFAKDRKDDFTMKWKVHQSSPNFTKVHKEIESSLFGLECRICLGFLAPSLELPGQRRHT